MSTLLKIHLPIMKGRINPRHNSNRVYPILEEEMPLQDLTQIDEGKRKNIIYQVIDWLDVENCERYSLKQNRTFCNIYAYDVAYCLGAYIPRVWWNDDSVKKILSQEEVQGKYGETLFELNSNLIYRWFGQYGSFFNWIKIDNISDLQNNVNKGTIGVIVSERHNFKDPGHIVIVIPEYKNHKAYKNGNVYLSPLQTQSGQINQKIFAKNNWWLDIQKFKNTDFWLWNIV